MSSGMAAHYFRFSLGQRVMHGMLMLSFLGLATTGLPLHFNQSPWAIWIAHTLGGFGVMGVFHRFFALLLSTLFVIHLGQILWRVFVLRELDILWGPNSMVPQPRDVRDFIGHMRWFLGAGTRPRFGRFTYWEKFDYFAVFWGMVVIGLSGYILWLNTFFSRFLPGWVFNLATVVHGEEALLAVGFIFTIHFFNSHLRPEKFPMDLVIFTGRVTEDELAHERPDEYDQLLAEQRLGETRAAAPPRWLRNFGLIVGSVAVAWGLMLFGLILVAVFRR